MALALDGSVHANATATSVNASLTTSASNCVIVAIVTTNSSGVTGISSTNTTGWTERVESTPGNPISIWYGVASSPLSSETITVSLGGSAYTTVDIFGISGADTTQIYDANGALPDQVGSSTLHTDITTTADDTFLISGYRFSSTANPTEGTGWTKISGAHYQLAQYKIVSTAQSALDCDIGTGDGNSNAGVADAVVIASAGGGPTYTLTAAAGTYTLTGNASGLIASRVLTAAQASFTLTGIAAGLKAGRVLTAAAATFTLTGIDAVLKASRVITAATGTFTLTGNDATLTYTPAGVDYTLTAGAGTFTLTGNAAGLVASRVLTADSGSYVLTGIDVGLTPGSGLTGRTRRGRRPIWVIQGDKKKVSSEALREAKAYLEALAAERALSDLLAEQRILRDSLEIATARQRKTITTLIATVERRVAEIEDEEVAVILLT